MNDDSILGKTLGQLGDIAKATGKQIVSGSSDMEEAVDKKLPVIPDAVSEAGNNTLENVSAERNKNTEEFVKGLYGAPRDSEKNDEKRYVSPGQKVQKPSEFEEQIKDKTPEEQKKLMQLRQQLHSQYYQNLVNPPKQQEERPAEKVEREKQEEMIDLQKKEQKKPKDLATRMASERVEKFPGASG